MPINLPTNPRRDVTRRLRTLPCGSYTLALGAEPLLMGILNVTPDSFSDGGAYADLGRAVARAEEMVAEGAAVIDIGGESTRPGALPVLVDEELRRTIPVIERLSRSLRVPISIDTSKATVAERALAAGAVLVNDVTALRGDARMAEVVAASGAPVVLMHMRGTPQTMRQEAVYADVVAEVIGALRERIDHAVACGIARDRLIVDPGIGFAKTAEQSLTLLAQLERFDVLDCPVLVGPSRKSFIGDVLSLPVEQRLIGTAVAVCLSVLGGADLIRVHDVGAMRQAVRLTMAIRGRQTAGVERNP